MAYEIRWFFFLYDEVFVLLKHDLYPQKHDIASMAYVPI